MCVSLVYIMIRDTAERIFNPTLINRTTFTFSCVALENAVLYIFTVVFSSYIGTLLTNKLSNKEKELDDKFRNCFNTSGKVLKDAFFLPL